MKILLATYWYLPHVGGVNTYVNVLRKELLKQGHEVDVLAHYNERNDKIYMLTTGEYLEKQKIKDRVYANVFHYYENHQPYVNHWIRWREIERYTYELAATFFNLDTYDLIHTQDIVSTRALSRVKPDGTPLVATIHGLLATEHVIAGDITSKKSLPWHYVLAEEYYGATSADRTIVPTNWLKRMLTSKMIKVPKHTLTTIPYGMDVDDLYAQYHAPTDEEIPFVKKGKKVMICPARMVPVKGHRYLLKALAKLKQKRNDFVCWLIGDGPLFHSLQSLCDQLNIRDVVHFLGQRKDVPQLLKRADMLVLPSIQDNHPFSIMEAQSVGKLVVASNAGGIPEMVKHKKTGFLFEKRNSDQLFAILHELLAKPLIGKKVAIQGKKWGQHQWASRTLYRNTMDVYMDVLKREE